MNALSALRLFAVTMIAVRSSRVYLARVVAEWLTARGLDSARHGSRTTTQGRGALQQVVRAL